MELPEDKRNQFKSPHGKLFENSDDAFEYVESINPKEIITVGDRVSFDFLKKGFKPDMMIVDFNIQRSPAEDDIRKTIENYDIPQVEIENPAGQLSEELLETIRSSKRPIKIIISGEEDLAVLPALINSPEKSILAYGQPNEGIVIVKVTEKKKNNFKELKKVFE